MKKKLPISVCIVLLAAGGFFIKQKFYGPRQKINKATEQIAELSANGEIKDGDIIFQTSLSGQSKAIQLATHSEFSHCGLINKNGNDFFVYEAVQPVKLTPLNEWIARGKDGHFVIKRLKNSSDLLTPEVITRIKKTGETFAGKNYDIYFGWSDDKIYCSELIWKIYKRSIGVSIGKLQQLR
ncbi:MAG TPA: YiiX/YebB-like N1pC/P60 family cysteine hydrolase, partial [Bacteroidia bacterium]